MDTNANITSVKRKTWEEVFSVRERIQGWNDYVSGEWREHEQETVQKRYESGRQLAAVFTHALQKFGVNVPLPRVRSGKQIAQLLGRDVAIAAYKPIMQFMFSNPKR